MKIIYQSFDGVNFDTRKECEKYEAKNAKPEMYSHDGITDDVSKAYVVDIRTEAELSWFLAKCNETYSSCEGIDDELFGIYVWDTWNEKYHYFDTNDDVIKAFIHYLKANNKI